MTHDHGITDEDRETLAHLASGANPKRFESYNPGTEDPIDLPPNRESVRHDFSKAVSKRIAEYADEHGQRNTAEHFGITRRSVEAHHDTWREDRPDKIEFVDRTRITEPMCHVMREMSRDGYSLAYIADHFDCAHRTAHLHVSATETCQHSLAVPRVDLHERRVDVSEDYRYNNE